AEQWRDAPSTAERERLFKEHGVRWSELWRLPYWDPARQLVVDAMHCILEGLVAHHTRRLLVLERIREVIRDISIPLWFESAPRNFGGASAGSIKADEWRSLIMVYVPIALISVLGAHNPDSDTVAVLDHTMSLVSAVYLACARTMTLERASAYRSCIASYVGNLKSLYPSFSLRPNHHASFHIFDYLVLFGPVHSWWTFPFERLIGVLQRLPSNHKPGESSL
ncbi:hypothetical protein BU15DRAFT_7288, partial [Melanogaster broomeanus]